MKVSGHQSIHTFAATVLQEVLGGDVVHANHALNTVGWCAVFRHGVQNGEEVRE